MESLASYIAAVLIAAASWFGLGVEPTSTAIDESVSAEVIYVVDGDTIDVFINGQKERVRYIGIDTPELAREAGEEDECFAKESTVRNRELLGNGKVTLVADTRDRDNYGRLLRYVYVGSLSIGEQLVTEGYAKAVYIKPDVTHYKKLKAAEKIAKTNEFGLWGECR